MASQHNVVLLVDNKYRDLMGCALIAHHLEKLGVDCHLETVGSYRGVLAAHRPDMIVFNQLTASHLVRYSERLKKLGVLTGVLTNEGISYEKELLKFIVGSHHTEAHIDHYFCWNEEKKEALEELGMAERTSMELVGVPRFDFYCKPWSRLFEKNEPLLDGKPRILVCTNFAHADFRDLPPEHSERFFAQLTDLPGFEDHDKAVEVHYENRIAFFDYLDKIVGSQKFNVILRPHPFESKKLYREWYEKQSAEIQRNVILDEKSSITSLILNSELQISCETCTTAIEAWIAHKPTIELVFQRYPLYFHDVHASLSPLCEKPDDVVSVIERELANPDQPSLREARDKHLRTWCLDPNGTACEKVAQTIARGVKAKKPADWSQLTLNDKRRGMKLKMLRAMGQNYQFDPGLAVRSRLFKQRYAIKAFTHGNFIKPRDVVEAKQRINDCVAAQAAADAS